MGEANGQALIDFNREWTLMNNEANRKGDASLSSLNRQADW
jgi:hypothetical protein